jgi:hypothetical protein
MMPSIRRKEWRELVTGSIDPRINSHSLRIKLNLIRRKVILGTMSPDNAVMELFVECKSHFNLYKYDLQNIFMMEPAEHI